MSEDILSNLDEALRARLERAGTEAMRKELEAIKAEATGQEHAALAAELKKLYREPTKNRARIREIEKTLGW